MQLADAVDDHLVRRGIVVHFEGWVLVHDLVEATREFLFVAAGLRFDRQAEHRAGISRLGQVRHTRMRADRVTDVQTIDLGHGDEIAGDSLGDWSAGLALYLEQAGDASAFAGTGIERLVGWSDLALQDSDVA